MGIQILLGEDHPVVIKGLTNHFSGTSVEIAQVFSNPDELKQQVPQYPGCVVVSEIRLGKYDMLTVLGELSETPGFPSVIFFSSADDQVSMARALAMSAADYVVKTETLDVLETSIFNAAHQIKADKSRPLSQRRIQLTAARVAENGSSPLTQRELQVLRHVSMGLSNREIGKSLGISVETIKEHVQNILRKLDVNDRTQAAIWAIRHNLV